MQALMACPCLKFSMPKADAPSPLGPAGVPTWPGDPSGELGNPCFSFWVSFAGRHCLHATCPESLISLCFNPADRSPSSLVGVTLAVLGPQPWVAPWTVQCRQEKRARQPRTRRGSLALCPRGCRDHLSRSHWQCRFRKVPTLWVPAPIYG